MGTAPQRANGHRAQTYVHGTATSVASVAGVEQVRYGRKRTQAGEIAVKTITVRKGKNIGYMFYRW